MAEFLLRRRLHRRNSVPYLHCISGGRRWPVRLHRSPWLLRQQRPARHNLPRGKSYTHTLPGLVDPFFNSRLSLVLVPSPPSPLRLPSSCRCIRICREATVPAAARSTRALRDRRRPAPPPPVPPPARWRSPATTSRQAPVSTPSAPRCLLPYISPRLQRLFLVNQISL